MEIVEINRQNLSDINKANQPFEIIGKIIPIFVDGIWSYTEEIYEHHTMKSYPVENRDYAAYINNPDKAVFLAYYGAECVGQIILKRDWNRYAFRIFVLQNRPEGKE